MLYISKKVYCRLRSSGMPKKQDSTFHILSFSFFSHALSSSFLPGIHDNNKRNDMCGEKDTEKNLSSRRELNPRPSVH